MLAVDGCAFDAANVLIAKGADVNAKDATGATALLRALRHERLIKTRILRTPWERHFDGTVQTEGVEQDVALHNAYRQLAMKLLDVGADPNPKDEEGNAPLYNAARDGDEELARLLVAKGGDVNAQGSRGATALHQAAYKSRGITELLLSHGAVVNAQDRHGDTPLHNAAARDHAGIVALLLANGANPDVRNLTGETPLDKASRLGRKQVIELLRKHGATE